MSTYNYFRIFVLLAAVTLAAALLALAVPLGQPARTQVISPEANVVGAGRYPRATITGTIRQRRW